MLLRESNDKYVAIEKCSECGCYVFGWKFSSLNPNICEFCTAQPRLQSDGAKVPAKSDKCKHGFVRAWCAECMPRQ